MELEDVRQHYEKNREEIESRLEEFHQLRDASERRWFKELVFVILTSQSSAEDSWNTAEELDAEDMLLGGEESEIEEILAGYGIQYEKNKASYIVENRDELSQPTLADPSGALKLRSRVDQADLEKTREQLVDQVKGISWKGASHFLRNIGYGNSFAIVSSRITSKLSELGVLETPEQPSRKEDYMEVEEKMQKLAAELEIEVKALDLVLWSMETGEVFK